VAYYDARWGYRKVDARRYERRRFGSRQRRLNQRLLERAITRALSSVPRGGLILDAPCGTGILVPMLRRLGFRSVGADIGQAMLEVARERGHDLGLMRADLECPPLRPRSVDAVVCSRFLMLLPPATRPVVLSALAAATRGPVVATVCHPYTYKSAVRRLRRFVGLATKQPPRFTRRALEAEVLSAGLVLEQVIPVAPLFSEVWVLVLRTP
jgi:SAM-dependent methyltransferase